MSQDELDDFDIFRAPAPPSANKTPADERRISPSDPAASADPSNNSPTDSKPLILIIDDDPSVRDMLAASLQNKQFDVLLCENGEAGIQTVSDQTSAVLLDIKMYGKDGFQTFKEIKEKFSHLPIIFHSAYQDLKDPYEIMNEYKPFAYVNKGKSFKEIYDTLVSAVDYYQQIMANYHLVNQLSELNQAYERFVPKDFLEFLNKDSILDLEYGDYIEQEMTVLFSDIRSFTALSESMLPSENFRFLNSYLQRMAPAIQQHHGVIDKFIGDAIMALFPRRADDAVLAAIAMQNTLAEYNVQRKKEGNLPVSIGIGINTGKLILGTVGAHNRMEGTVISDAVNLGARVEGMTKMYQASIMISSHTFYKLEHPQQFDVRVVDQVLAEGKSTPVTVWEVFTGDPPEIQEAKRATAKPFEEAIAIYYLQEFDEALTKFNECLSLFPGDKVAQIYIERCKHYLKVGWDDDWDGVARLHTK